MTETEEDLSLDTPKQDRSDIQIEKAAMLQPALSQLAIAVASDSLQQRTNLRRILGQSGLNVVLSEPLTRLFLRKLEKAHADVLLLDLHDDIDHDEELLHEVLDKVEIPIIFNDVTALTLNESAADSKWHFSLMQKIAESKGIENWQSDEIEETKVKDELPFDRKNRTERDIARYVWVLGASLGGPEAVKRFLKTLPKDISAAFIVAQHLGANFVGHLAEQLDRSTVLKVMVPKEGHVLHDGDVIIAPVGERITINPIGNIELDVLREEYKYSPSIDMVISDVAERYGARAGAIIFSGMGDDGKEGCAKLLDKGGQVWLQSSESCVINSMPENVRRACETHYTGNPEQLAKQLSKHLQTSEVV